MGNFDYLRDYKQFEMFSGAAIDAERTLNISPPLCALACRRAFELAVKWVYSADRKIGKSLVQDNLQSLVHGREFVSTISDSDPKILSRVQFLIKIGNENAHEFTSVTFDQAQESLRILYSFIHCVDRIYGKSYVSNRCYDPKLVPTARFDYDPEAEKRKDAEIEDLRKQVADLSEKYTAERERNEADKSRTYVPEEITEFDTRKLYIDVDLRKRGWTSEGPNADVFWEYELNDMCGNPGQKGYADYVLFGRDGLPLAVIEAKRTSVDPNNGRTQVQLYADCLERKFGRRPIMYTTNGFETYFWDDVTSPQRRVSGVSSRADLQRLINRRTDTRELATIPISDAITDRYYQKAAIRAVCQEYDAGIRKHLVVMATGTGKTRTVASLVDVLSRGGQVTNVLFLADRRALVKQAKESFSEYLPDMTLCNLCSNRDDLNSRIVFSTYPTILNAIDTARNDDDSQLFTPAHFDLIIIDESHRSIFNKYRAIFDYFDAHIVGLTATPKTDVDRNTYDFFDKEDGIPTYAYDYETAVNLDHVLVPYYNYEVKTNFIENGITYDSLSESDKERYESDFAEDGEVPDEIPSAALNRYVFNEKTIDIVLQDLMDRGIRINGGDHIGKTIIFAQNKNHAEAIRQRFDRLYPQYKGLFAKRVVEEEKYAQDTIDAFKKRFDMKPQVVISVDMMDTGIDVPDCVNLVFFKKVRSKTKFWQMIGRGTRRYDDGVFEDSIDGQYIGKRRFLIFDYCGNFQFFREHIEGYESSDMGSLSQRIFQNRVRIIALLQGEAYLDDRHQALRSGLVDTCCEQVKELNLDLTIVSMRRRYVERYSKLESYQSLSDDDKKELIEMISPLISSDGHDEKAMYFDNLIYALMVAILSEGRYAKVQKSIRLIAEDLKTKATIPQVKERMSTIKELTSDEIWTAGDVIAFERVREELRGLMQFLDRDAMRPIVTSLSDVVLESESGLESPTGYDFEDYRSRVNRYITDHQDEGAIYKLNHNIPMTREDVEELTHIFVGELGDRSDYQREFGEEDLGVMIRKTVKLDHESVMKAFSEFINDASLNPQQIEFVRKIINYVEKEGYMDLGDLMRSPFDKPKGFIRMFDKRTQERLVDTISGINRNAETTSAEQ